jgi:hypothetical protein
MRVVALSEKFMNAVMVSVIAAAALIGTLVLWYRWDSEKNRGRKWGYWGEFKNVSNALAGMPGITIVKPWYNADLTLEEFGFEILVQGREVKLGFGEKDPVRNLSGQDLERALTGMVKHAAEGGDDLRPNRP